MQPLSNPELEITAPKQSLKMGLNLGRMGLKFLIGMLVNINIMQLVSKLDNIVRISKITGKICHACLIEVLAV